MSENLWGKLPTGENVVTPASILREQAAVLGAQTKGLVTADVIQETDVYQTIGHRFVISAPSLQYQQTLFSVYHKAEIYPLNLVARGGKGAVDIEDEQEFRKQLKAILSADATHRLVGALLAQVKADRV